MSNPFSKHLHRSLPSGQQCHFSYILVVFIGLHPRVWCMKITDSNRETCNALEVNFDYYASGNLNLKNLWVETICRTESNHPYGSELYGFDTLAVYTCLVNTGVEYSSSDLVFEPSTLLDNFIFEMLFYLPDMPVTTLFWLAESYY